MSSDPHERLETDPFLQAALRDVLAVFSEPWTNDGPLLALMQRFVQDVPMGMLSAYLVLHKIDAPAAECQAAAAMKESLELGVPDGVARRSPLIAQDLMAEAESVARMTRSKTIEDIHVARVILMRVSEEARTRLELAGFSAAKIDAFLALDPSRIECMDIPRFIEKPLHRPDIDEFPRVLQHDHDLQLLIQMHKEYSDDEYEKSVLVSIAFERRPETNEEFRHALVAAMLHLLDGVHVNKPRMMKAARGVFEKLLGKDTDRYLSTGDESSPPN